MKDESLNQLTHNVIGAAIEVHRQLGPGYLEALAIEFAFRKIPCHRQYPVCVSYRGQAVGEARLDFLIEDRLILELKAVENLLPVHTAQVISYLKATHCTYGLLINFNVEVLTKGIRRLVLD